MISKFKPETEFYTDERCYIVEMHNREEDEGCSIVRARVAPGVTTTTSCATRHRLNATSARSFRPLSACGSSIRSRGPPGCSVRLVQHLARKTHGS